MEKTSRRCSDHEHSFLTVFPGLGRFSMPDEGKLGGDAGPVDYELPLPTVYSGNFVHMLGLRDLRIVENGYIYVDQYGVIQWTWGSDLDINGAPSHVRSIIRYGRNALGERTGPCARTVVLEYQGQRLRWIDLAPTQFLIPGLVDTHTHAPQYPFGGCGRLPLLKWLEKYTFPTEAKFKNVDLAVRMYKAAVKRFVSNGTTTCCYFATIHRQSSVALAALVRAIGQRAFVGKVCMDRNSPDNYQETTEASLRDTESFLREVLSLENRYRLSGKGDQQAGRPLLTFNKFDSADARKEMLVLPVITPRFVPTCSSTLMKGLGDLASKYGLPIQSHISENCDEIAWVKSLHPECHGYADVYAQHGLLNDWTVMAHGIHLTEDERKSFKQRGVGLSHCPNSNYSLDSGILNVRRCLIEGLKIGLGTDVAGGYHPSILDAMRQCIIASKSVVFARQRRRRELKEHVKPGQIEEITAEVKRASRKRPRDTPKVTEQQQQQQVEKKVCHSNNVAILLDGESKGESPGHKNSAVTLPASSARRNSPEASKRARRHWSVAAKAIRAGTIMSSARASFAFIRALVRTLGAPSSPVNFKEAFYLATLGGAQVMGLQNVVGNFQKGKQFDAVLVDSQVNDSPFDVFCEAPSVRGEPKKVGQTGSFEAGNGALADTLMDVFQKFVFLGDDRNLMKVWVRGEVVCARKCAKCGFENGE